MKWREPADRKKVKGKPARLTRGAGAQADLPALPPEVGKKKAPKWERGLWLTANNKKLNHDGVTS
jgi:hypothetical protein